MHLVDTSLVLAMLRMPRLALSPDQIQKIERIIDGAPMAEDRERSFFTFKEAMAMLGFKTRQGVAKWIQRGTLAAYVPPGRAKAMGVTRESMERALARRAG